MELEHQMALLNLNIKELKEKSQGCRSRLRATEFEAFEENDGKPRFFIKGELPPNKKRYGRIWRLKVGNQSFDETAIAFVGGGSVVGKIPKGLPVFSLPRIDFKVMLTLFPICREHPGGRCNRYVECIYRGCGRHCPSVFDTTFVLLATIGAGCNYHDGGCKFDQCAGVCPHMASSKV